MPVDYTGAIVAFFIWVGGTLWAFRRLRTKLLSKYTTELAAYFYIYYWTFWISMTLAGLGIFIIWFYDWVRGRW